MNGLRASRLLLAIAFAGLAAGASAQEAAQNAARETPAEETLGPRELRNFSLDGRVVRPAEQPPETAAPPPPVAVAPSPARRDPVLERSIAAAEPAAADERPRISPPVSDMLSRPPTRPQPRSATAAPPTVAGRAPLEIDSPPQEGSSLLMWLAGLLGLAGLAAVAWFLRSGRSRYALVGGREEAAANPLDGLQPPERQPAASERSAAPRPPSASPAKGPPVLRPKPDPVPAGRAAAPRPQPVSAPPPAGGIVSSLKAGPQVPAGAVVASSLRPWIDVELTPDRALVDDQGAAIAFDVTLINSGSAPARDVTIEACLLNAGAAQDVELGEFYQRPRSSPDSIPVIAPMARVPLRTAVRIPRDKIREYEVDGRKLFMPMVAVSTRYRWSSGEGQTGASFLVGKGREEAEKLAPLRIDQGARSWAGLGARRYEKGLRR